MRVAGYSLLVVGTPETSNQEQAARILFSCF